MPRSRIRAIRSIARDDHSALRTITERLPEPLRVAIAPSRPWAGQRTEEVIDRVFRAAEENRRA